MTFPSYFGSFGSMAVATLVAASQASSSEALADATTSTLEVALTSRATAQAVLDNAFMTSLALWEPTVMSENSAFGPPTTSFSPMLGNTFTRTPILVAYRALHSWTPSSSTPVNPRGPATPLSTSQGSSWASDPSAPADVVVGRGFSEVSDDADGVVPAVGFPGSCVEQAVKPTHSATIVKKRGIAELLV